MLAMQDRKTSNVIFEFSISDLLKSPVLIKKSVKCSTFAVQYILYLCMIEILRTRRRVDEQDT